MKYFDTLLEDQETTISVLYKEQIVRIYSSEVKTIHRLVKVLGQPTNKYKKSKTYWSGASWDISFFDIDKLKEILYRDTFIDNRLKPTIKEEKKSKKVSKTTDKKINNKEEKKSEKVSKAADKKTNNKEDEKKTIEKSNKKKSDSEKKDIEKNKKKPSISEKKVIKKDAKSEKKVNVTKIEKPAKTKTKKVKHTDNFEQIQFIF